MVPERGGIYALTWGDSIDNPEYVTVSRLSEYEFGKKLSMKNETYYSAHGQLPFDADLVANFYLEEGGSGTEVKVVQTGIPIDTVADDFFEGTVKGWETTLTSLKNVVEDEALSTANLMSGE